MPLLAKILAERFCNAEKFWLVSKMYRKFDVERMS